MRIQWKLFLIILCSSALLVLGMFVTMQWSVDRGLLKYVNIREQQANAQIIEQLATAYSVFGDWRFLQNRPHLLQRFASEANPESAPPPRPAFNDADPNRRPPPRDNSGQPAPRLRPEGAREGIARPSPFTVLNPDKQFVAGAPLAPDVTLSEITHPDTEVLIGWLAFRAPKRLSDDFDLALADELKTGFVSASLAMLVISSALAIPLSFLLVRRIRHITGATHQLANGEFRHRLNDTSKDELGQLARDFNALAKTLEDTDSARKRWFADISHELRTPLAVTRGEIEAMIDGIRPANETNLRSALDEITHLHRLIDDLYQLSNADIGALQYLKSETDLRSLLEKEVAHFESLAQEAGLTLCCSAETKDARVFADADRLKQLLHNLLHNAIKYTHAPGEIHLKLTATPDRARLIIEDSAPGATADELARLFDPLYRVESSRNRKSGGSGLGLAICRQIVLSHEGSIEATQSALGGIRITIELPLIKAA